MRVELATSADGENWQTLGSASLFRLGAGSDLQASALGYPATEARFLRLRWPTAAGLPRLAGVQLDTVAAAAEDADVPLSRCAAAGARRTVCDLASLGERPLTAIAVTLPAGASAGWRLRSGRAGAWSTLGDGTWSALAAAVPRPLLADTQAPLLLELWGESGPPQPTRVVARLVPLALEIESRVAGTYELQSGRGLPRPPPAAAAAAGTAEWVVPGPARPLPAAPLPEIPAGAALPSARFTHRWLVGSSAGVGEAVRLVLPAPVQRAARADLGDLRLSHDGVQVPYLLDAPDTPEPAGGWDELLPRPVQDGTSAVDLASPPGGAQLLLRTPARPLRRPVRLLRRAAPERVDRRGWIGSSWTEWSCDPLPPLPCEIALEVPTGEGPLRLEIDDGDNAPLPHLAAEAWRRRRELLFPWPGKPVALLAGAPELPPPRYDLAALAGDLRARAIGMATVGEEQGDRSGGEVTWPRWAVIASVGLAAAVLLLLLARALPRTSGEG